MKFNEDSRVKIPAIIHLTRLGYDYISLKNNVWDSFIYNYLKPIPEYKLVEKYYDKVNPIYTKIQHNLKENEKLVELRDWLLPMLMNGQVTVT